MRLAIVLLLLCPSFASAQTEETIQEIERKIAKLKAAKWVLQQEAEDGGFYLAPQPPNIDAKPVPSLRATNGAVRALKYLGFPQLKGEREKHGAFVLKCYDPKTGGFAEMGGKPDVAITAIGVMAAMELQVPKEKFAKAMDYLKENAKTFEEVRIAAAAVEAWGVKDCPFKLDEWFKVAKAFGSDIRREPNDGGARDAGAAVAMWLRLGRELPGGGDEVSILKSGQRADGGWNVQGEKASDIETTYRVMRALVLLNEKPKDTKKLRAFIESHRTDDHGFALKPGAKASMSGAYYCVIVSKWLDEMDAKK
jgi:prenyltransferase beta subunit